MTKKEKFTTCPRCGYPGVDSRTSKGGKAGTGKAKARPSAMARRAALLRWGHCPECYGKHGGEIDRTTRKCNKCGYIHK